MYPRFLARQVVLRVRARQQHQLLVSRPIGKLDSTLARIRRIVRIARTRRTGRIVTSGIPNSGRAVV